MNKKLNDKGDLPQEAQKAKLKIGKIKSDMCAACGSLKKSADTMKLTAEKIEQMLSIVR